MRQRAIHFDRKGVLKRVEGGYLCAGVSGLEQCAGLGDIPSVLAAPTDNLSFNPAKEKSRTPHT